MTKSQGLSFLDTIKCADGEAVGHDAWISNNQLLEFLKIEKGQGFPDNEFLRVKEAFSRAGFKPERPRASKETCVPCPSRGREDSLASPWRHQQGPPARRLDAQGPRWPQDRTRWPHPGQRLHGIHLGRRRRRMLEVGPGGRPGGCLRPPGGSGGRPGPSRGDPHEVGSRRPKVGSSARPGRPQRPPGPPLGPTYNRLARPRGRRPRRGSGVPPRADRADLSLSSSPAATRSGVSSSSGERTETEAGPSGRGRTCSAASIPCSGLSGAVRAAPMPCAQPLGTPRARRPRGGRDGAAAAPRPPPPGRRSERLDDPPRGDDDRVPARIRRRAARRTSGAARGSGAPSARRLFRGPRRLPGPPRRSCRAGPEPGVGVVLAAAPCVLSSAYLARCFLICRARGLLPSSPSSALQVSAPRRPVPRGPRPTPRGVVSGFI